MTIQIHEFEHILTLTFPIKINTLSITIYLTLILNNKAVKYLLLWKSLRESGDIFLSDSIVKERVRINGSHLTSCEAARKMSSKQWSSFDPQKGKLWSLIYWSCEQYYKYYKFSPAPLRLLRKGILCNISNSEWCSSRGRHLWNWKMEEMFLN